MLLCDTGAGNAEVLDDLVVFASQARAAGLPISIHKNSIPDDCKDSSQIDFASFLTDARADLIDQVIIIGAETVNDSRLRQFRMLSGGRALNCVAWGNFETRQKRIATSARLSYAFGKEPRILDVPKVIGLPATSAPVFGASLRSRPRSKPIIGLIFPDIGDSNAVSGVRALSLARDFQVEIICGGKSKSRWKTELGPSVPVWHPGELLPRALAVRFDVAVLLDSPPSWYRLQTLVANLAGAGTTLVDGTSDRSWSLLGSAIIPGTPDMPMLGTWLQSSILPNIAPLRSEILTSKLHASLKLPPELAELMPSPPPVRRAAMDTQEKRVVFMPTNGVGLGHAKRCSLIARELSDHSTATFAAFPSCLEMLNRGGFDAMPLVGRTPLRNTIDSDLVNHSRLNALAANASAFVFDGGYVFDSVMRSVADNVVPAVWVRRGLWQDGQNNSVALDRQKLFDRIVVPLETFEELNGPSDQNTIEVGPIVHNIDLSKQDRVSLRAELSNVTNRGFHKLVVTMLGGGVAADRRAQINAICAHLAANTGVLHCLVVWPTAIVEPAWSAHENTVVVQTHHARSLIGASDLFVSAVGYNSFHEALYGGIPTIFLPQMASFMDDQRARARAAADRGVALLVEPWEILKLTGLIDECLEGRTDELKSKLQELNLPEPGMKAAANAIEEVIG